MKKKLIAMSVVASFACVTLGDAASALESGSAIQPGTEFPAAPMSKGGISLSAPTQVVAPPAASAPEAAPPPEPVKKRRKRRR